MPEIKITIALNEDQFRRLVAGELVRLDVPAKRDGDPVTIWLGLGDVGFKVILDAMHTALLALTIEKARLP